MIKRVEAVAKFLQAAKNLSKQGISKEQIMEFAKREFGEVSDLLKRQIEQIFTPQTGGITSIKKPEGEVIDVSFKPGVDKRGKVVEESPSQASGTSIDQEDFLSRIRRRIQKDREESQRAGLGKLIDETEGIEFSIPSQGIIRQKGTADEIMNYLSTNPYRKGGPLDPNTGMTRTAARDILRRLLDEGKITIPDERERDAIAKGYQGGVDPIVVFEKVFGRENLQDLSELADEMNRAGDYTELQKILQRENLYGLKQKDKYEPDPGGMTDDELRELLKKNDVDPDDTGFATGGRVGYSDGNDDPKKKLIKKIPRVGKIVSGIEALPAAIKKIKDKFGEKSITTADKIEQPESAKLREEFERFNKDNPLPTEGERLLKSVDEKFAKPKPGKMEMKGIGTITTNTDFAASLKDPKLFDPDAKNIYGDKVKTGDKFYSEMETLYTNMIARKKREMPDRSNRNYGLLQSSLKDAEDSLEAIKITRALGGNENMFDKIRTSNLGLGRGDERRPVEFSNYVDLPDDVDPRDTILPMGEELTPLMKERFELKRKFPGIDDETLNAILDMDMDKKANLMADMKMGMKLLEEGKGVDEVKDIFEKAFRSRKQNAGGGLNYLMGM